MGNSRSIIFNMITLGMHFLIIEGPIFDSTPHQDAFLKHKTDVIVLHNCMVE